MVTGIALSIDNLAVGFALGTYHVGLVVAEVTIGVVSVTMSLLGLELGGRLGTRTGERGNCSAAWSSSPWAWPWPVASSSAGRPYGPGRTGRSGTTILMAGRRCDEAGRDLCEQGIL